MAIRTTHEQRSRCCETKKVVCPNCGGPLTVERLCQCEMQFMVSKITGRVSKKAKRVNYGTIADNQLFCNHCGKCFGDGEFVFDGNSVRRCNKENYCGK